MYIQRGLQSGPNNIFFTLEQYKIKIGVQETKWFGSIVHWVVGAVVLTAGIL